LFENAKLEVEIDESQITRKTRIYLEDTTRQELYEERQQQALHRCWEIHAKEMLNASYRALFEEEEEEDKQALQQAFQWPLEGQRSVNHFSSFIGASPQTPGLAALEEGWPA
jgi:hypothetical protein